MIRDTWTNYAAVCLLHVVKRLDSYWPLEGNVARLLVNKVLLELLGDVAVAVVVLIHALLQLVWLVLQKRARETSGRSHRTEKPVTDTAQMGQVKVIKLSQNLHSSGGQEWEVDAVGKPCTCCWSDNKFHWKIHEGFKITGSTNRKNTFFVGELWLNPLTFIENKVFQHQWAH